MPGEGEKPRLKADSQQAVVQTGQLGFYPVNSISLSALYHGQTDVIVGEREDPLTDKFRGLAETVISKKPVALAGKMTTSISDAFYRGKLPEVLVISAHMLDIPLFIEEFMDFLDKLCSLGFMTREDGDDAQSLDRFIPEMVIASYGIVFDVVHEKVRVAMESMGAISAWQRERILQKLSRAVFVSPGEGYDLSLAPPVLYPQPLGLNFAGSKSMYTVKTTQILENKKISCHFNPNGEVGIRELELNLGYKHLVHRILPVLKSRKIKVESSSKQLTQWIDEAGQNLGILPGLAVVAEKPGEALAPENLHITTEDLAILHQLRSLARQASARQLVEALDHLMDHLKPLVESPSTTAAV